MSFHRLRLKLLGYLILITPFLENVIEEALDKNKTVYVVVNTAKAKEKLQNLGLHTRLRDEDFTQSRTAALEMALDRVSK